jgi:hypothetical protein
MKHLQILVILALLLPLAACLQHQFNAKASAKNTDTILIDLPCEHCNFATRYRTGYRIQISGDFNGDGKTDTIYESYISALTGAETYKDMDSIYWEENVVAIMKNKPISRFYTNIRGVDTFIVNKDSQQRGTWLLENLGDVYGGKGDELGYVVNWADYSNTNTYHIITLLNGKWRELYQFDINEAVNYQPENLFDSTSIIKPLEHGKIRHKYFDIHAEISDTVVTLKLK